MLYLASSVVREEKWVGMDKVSCPKAKRQENFFSQHASLKLVWLHGLSLNVESEQENSQSLN